MLELEDILHRDLLDRSDETLQFILRLLVDGEWHDREEIVAAARHVIPPGKAYRKAEYRRLQKLRSDVKKEQGWTDEQVDEWMADPENTKRRATTRATSTQEGIVRTGQRIYVSDALNGTSRIEQKKEGDRTWVRRIPLPPVITETQTAKDRRAFMKEVIGFLATHTKIEPVEDS
jgi:hypothetical protein